MWLWIRSNDVVLAREDDESGRSFGLLKKIRADPSRVQAAVVPWSSGDDVFDVFDKLL